MTKPKNQQNKPIKILFLAANPQDTGQLRLDEEIREIKQALLQAEFRDKFTIEQEWAVRVSDGDEAAISFAVAFYQALGFGKDVKTALQLP